MPDTPIPACHCTACEVVLNITEESPSRVLCEDCRGTCEHCDAEIASDDLLNVRQSVRRSSGTASWCQSCTDSDGFECADCSDTFNVNLRCGTNSNDDAICEHCAESYFTCDGCNSTVHNDDYGEDGRCQSCCRDSEEESDSSPLIRGHSYRPALHFYGKGPVYFGVELEVEAENIQAAAESTAAKLGSFAILKEDGSLRHGFEIVTQPATLEEHNKQWAPFFEKRPAGLKSFDTKTCGLHVHVSRKPLSQLSIGKLLVFVNNPANRAFVECIAGRPAGQWAAYRPKKCSDAKKHNESRYEAVNLQNDGTIEFRIFKGTLRQSSFFKAIEFCAAVVSFCSTAERSIEDSSSLKLFLKFCHDNRKTYPNLWAFVHKSWIGQQTTTELGFKIISTVKPDTTETTETTTN